MASLLSVADALARVLDGVEPLPRADAPLTEAAGRVLAADVAALRTQPPADLSAMDGYAVRAADVANVPATLKIVGEVATRCRQGGVTCHAIVGRNNLDPFGERIIDLNSEIADRTLDLRVAKQELNCSKISRFLIDQSCLGSSE